jgi:hypothetical protein
MPCHAEFTVKFASLLSEQVSDWRESLRLMLDMLEQAESELEEPGLKSI